MLPLQIPIVVVVGFVANIFVAILVVTIVPAVLVTVIITTVVFPVVVVVKSITIFVYFFLEVTLFTSRAPENKTGTSNTYYVQINVSQNQKLRK